MTQIPQELIDRLRKCCEWLGDNRKDKFEYISNLKTLWLLKYEMKLIDFELPNPIMPDPLCEYPNALHRVVKEACNKILQTKVIDNGWYYSELFDRGKNKGTLNLDKRTCSHYSNFPLHAEIEATCMAVEEIIK